MITRRTTLILGAGASAPFGFPTGYELLKEVILRLGDTRLQGFRGQLGWLNHKAEDLKRFREALAKCGKTSVDSFLEHRPEFIPIGKAAIAATLIDFENEDALFKRDGKSWYEYLFNQLTTTFDDFGENKLSILTFNYDRSLEHFLLASLMHAYGMSEVDCAKKLKEIPIIHLHGMLGSLPFLGDKFRNYDTKMTPMSLERAADGIKIIHEGIEKEPQFTEAHGILSASEFICFLGFGFHSLNLRRLGFNNLLAYNNCSINASTFGLTNAERGHLNRITQGRLTLNNQSTWNCDVLQFLRESGLLQIASY